MMQLTARMVRGYKGAAASILLLMIFEQRAMSQEELRRNTGYGDEAIHDAVLMLREDGFLVETGRYTWALPGALRQLPLGAVDNSVDKIEPAVDKSAKAVETAPTDPELALNESMNQSIITINEDHSLIDASSGKSGAEQPSREKLAQLGFYGRGLVDLLSIDGLTMREVRYHAQTAASLGWALARIKRRQAVPDDFEREAASGANCLRCMHYAMPGEYARIDGIPVCFDCMDDAEYEQYGPDG